MLEDFGDIQRITERDFEEFSTMDGQQAARDKMEKELSDLVQKRLHRFPILDIMQLILKN